MVRVWILGLWSMVRGDFMVYGLDLGFKDLGARSQVLDLHGVEVVMAVESCTKPARDTRGGREPPR